MGTTVRVVTDASAYRVRDTANERSESWRTDTKETEKVGSTVASLFCLPDEWYRNIDS